MSDSSIKVKIKNILNSLDIGTKTSNTPSRDWTDRVREKTDEWMPSRDWTDRVREKTDEWVAYGVGIISITFILAIIIFIVYGLYQGSSYAITETHQWAESITKDGIREEVTKSYFWSWETITKIYIWIMETITQFYKWVLEKL